MRVLGLDVGIASVGWWLLTVPDPSDKQPVEPDIGTGGTWMHDAPEDRTQSGTKLRSEARRLFRGQRKVIRRRRLRMNQLRRLFAEHGLLDGAERDALQVKGVDPWALRVAGLDRALEPQELAIALGHIARHRGFKSNAKTVGKNSEEKGMLKDLAQTSDKIALFRTPAEAVMQDPFFVQRSTKRCDGGTETVRMLRNRDGQYFRTFKRDDLSSEIGKLFEAQRRLGMTQATPELRASFLDIAFYQRPLQDSEHMVGTCPFEPAEMRAAKRGISFERFRYLSRLNTLKLVGRDESRITPEEIAAAFADFGATAKISFTALRKKIGLPAHVGFDGVKPDEETKRDVVARTGEAAAGAYRLRKLIGDTHGAMSWRALADNRPDLLDRVAEVISFRDDLERIELGLSEIDLDPAIRETLLRAAGAGDLDIFAGAGHISAKAARNILPGLLRGLTYDKACVEAHYDHTASRERHAFDTGAEGKEALSRLIKQERISRELIGSPTARKALLEALKQVKAIVEAHGLPDRIHVELARAVGKSIEERDELERGIEKRNKQKEKLRALFADLVGEPESWKPTATEMRKFELWQEQQYRCLYTRDYDKSLIDVRWLRDSENRVEIDHILPWSRFSDDSFHNMTLCLTDTNRDKRNQTPREWLGGNEAIWIKFEGRIKALPYLKGMKRRNYLLENADEAAERFKSRNLNDTRWTCRLLAEALRQVLPDRDIGEVDERSLPKKVRRVFVRPGALTDRMRRAWGLQSFKKDDKLKRIPDDRHHALDALVLAATTESTLNVMTRKMQREKDEEKRVERSQRILNSVIAETQPWPDFRLDAKTALSDVFVARAPRARARGKAHDATIRQIREKDGQDIVFERKRVADLKPGDPDRMKDKDRNEALVATLNAWIADGSPKDRPPLSPKGDPISKVRLESKGKVAIRLHRGGPENRAGAVDRGEMARVDVYAKATPKGVKQYFLVPIYPHEIATQTAPPNRAVAAYKPESEWPVMDETYEFLWSLVPMTPLKVVDKAATRFFVEDKEKYRAGQGDPQIGYFRGLDRATGAINLSSVADPTWVKTGIGARTLVNLQKLTVDRLGRTFAVRPETRSWHGKACI